ncbi:hypothetical protein [Hyphobacterium sp.]|uniref:hypothetical protein n=1 Tax=Hyphobacterium sp. TaxID=2004662 RepID=UPI003B51BA0D
MSNGYRHTQHVTPRLVVTFSERTSGPAPKAADFERAAKFLAVRACYFRCGAALSEGFYRIADRLSAGDAVFVDCGGRFSWRSGAPDTEILELLNAPDAGPEPAPVRKARSVPPLTFWAGALAACAAFCVVQLAAAVWGAL